MDIVCPRCQHRYRLATVRLGGRDRTAACGGCGHRFVVRLPGPAAAHGPTAQAAPPPIDMTAVGRAGPSRAGGLAPHVRVALTVLDGEQKDRLFPISGDVTVIGRTQGEIQVSDPRVSGRHAQIEISGGNVWLRDLGSTNGTAVNGERITHVRLKHLDEVTVGATRLLYTYIEDFVSAYESFGPEA